MNLSIKRFIFFNVILLVNLTNCFCQDTTDIFITPTFIATYLPKQPFSLASNNPYLIGGTVINYKKVYGELRYNYDQLNTFGIYAGKSFAITKPKMEHLFIPQLGALVGDYKGASLQFYYLGYHKRFEISLLNQYSVPLSGQSQFYYNWSGIDFTIYKAFKLGASGQYYSDVQINNNNLNAGLSAAIKTYTTTFQLYWFNFYDLQNQSFSIFIQQKISFKKRKKQ